MYHLVLSGGPSSGKSTSISKVCSALQEKLGMHVIICEEVATELITSGIFPSNKISMDEFQEFVLDLQLAKEELCRKAASFYDSNKVVIIYDRGILDQLAYIDRNKFEKLLKDRGLTIADVNNRYDTILHLVTAAKGTDCYTTENNSARRETPEEAIEKDEKTLRANMLHPHVRVIDNSTNFEEKVQRVINIVFDELNAPNPSEIERKFLIKYPTEDTLRNLEYSSVSNIIQTYLKNHGGGERRVRQRGSKENGYNFYYTEKIPVSAIERIERERKISSDEYIQFLSDADTGLHQVSKTRYCFIYENQYFEMDIYPYSTKHAIVEIELSSAEDEVKFPPFLEVVKEVTDDTRFKNHSIALTLTLDYPDVVNTVWHYETGCEEPEILGSGSNYSAVVSTRDEEYAFKCYKEGGRNYLKRYSYGENGRTTQYYNFLTSKWEN